MLQQISIQKSIAQYTYKYTCIHFINFEFHLKEYVMTYEKQN